MRPVILFPAARWTPTCARFASDLLRQTLQSTPALAESPLWISLRGDLSGFTFPELQETIAGWQNITLQQRWDWDVTVFPTSLTHDITKTHAAELHLFSPSLLSTDADDIVKSRALQKLPFRVNIADIATPEEISFSQNTAGRTWGTWKTFENVAVGGTFDHFHAGHKSLLTACAAYCDDRLVVGVSGDELLKTKKFAEYLEPWSIRAKSVSEFLHLIKPSLHVEIVPLHDPFGPTITDPKIEALIVSDETKQGGDAVNAKRLEVGFSPLQIVSINLIQAEGEASKVSSTTFREKHAKPSQ